MTAARIKLAVSVYVPLHTSSLVTDLNRDYSLLFFIQCHSEGVLWKGLVPLLIVDNKHRQSSPIAQVAMRVLIDHYVRRLDTNHAKPADDNDAEDENHYDNCDWMVARVQTLARVECSSCGTTFNESKQHHLTVVILPPNPFYKDTTFSRMPSTSPTSLFAGRLIYYENKLIRLTSVSALISTLGGGFFLCHYLSTAVTMARQQHRIALVRGDEEMALRCRINEGYCYIHAGKLKRGKKIIKCVLRDVAKRQKQKKGIDVDVEESELSHTEKKELSELMVIKNMCISALRFAKLIKQQRLESTAEDQTQSATHDDFQRIRVVKNRIWKR